MISLSVVETTQRERPSVDLSGDLPRAAITIGWSATGAFLVLLFGLGLTARLDAAVVAPGRVVVLGNRRAVQHLEGGIISELNVHDGDRVQAGEVLIRLEGGEAAAGKRALEAQVIQLQAEQARLLAELSGRDHIEFPSDFRSLTGDEAKDVAVAESLEEREFATRTSALKSAQRLILSKEAESTEQIEGYRQQVTANREQQRLIGEEIHGLQGLLKQGLVPATRVRSLERAQAELTGSGGEYGADIARTRQEIAETQVRATDLSRQRSADDSRDYQAVQFQLGDLEPKLEAMKDVLARKIIRSPAIGRVVGLSVFTVGGVVAPGQKLMEIVPQDDPLVIEADVKPTDVADLRVGQRAELRVSAFHDAGMPKIIGRVVRISADAITDDKTGSSFFKIIVTVPAAETSRIRERRRGESGIQPGLPVELVIPLRPRTALEYVTEPLHETLWRSFRER